MRILHLLDPAHCGDEGLLCAAGLMRGSGAYPTHHEAWLLGGEHDERRAWSLGIPTTDRIHPRAHADALPGLRRLWAARRAASAPDIVQCYSLHALRLARAVFGVARVALITRPPLDARTFTPASDLELASGREVIAAFDEATRRSLAPLVGVGGHQDAARWLPTIRLLEPPAFGHGGPVAVDRAAIRESLGLDPADVAIAWLADPPAAIDAAHVAYSGAVLHATGHRAVSLVRRGARDERRAAAYLRTHARRWGMLLVDCSLPELLGAADVCVVETSPAAATHPRLTPCGPVAASLALSMGVPIAAARGTFLTEAGSDWPAQPAISGAPGRIAVPIAAILEVASLRIGLASAARAWCDRARALDAFGTTLYDLWAEVAPGAAPRIAFETGRGAAG